MFWGSKCSRARYSFFWMRFLGWPRVIGALDVQSRQEAAFTEEDAAVLQIVADQVAVAIENARLFQGTEQALEDVQALQRYYVAREWERLSLQRDDLEAEYNSMGTSSLEAAWTPEMEAAWAQESPVVLPTTRGSSPDRFPPLAARPSRF